MQHLHLIGLAQCLALITVANGTPVVAKIVLADRLAYPLDGERTLWDGQPVFGKSKTIRGIVLAILLTVVLAPLLGVGVDTGMLIGVGAMAGDLFSSFVKRRLRLAPSSKAPALDQIPESLLPLWLAAAPLQLSTLDIAVGSIAFWIGELLLSRLLYSIKLRDRPY
jgi:hypothetical protein